MKISEKPSQRKFAEFIGIDQSRVSRGINDGEMALGTLSLVLSQLEKDLPDLPKTLEDKLMVVEGYRATLELLSGRPISLNDFCMLWGFSKYPEISFYIELINSGRADKLQEKRYKSLMQDAMDSALKLYASCTETAKTRKANNPGKMAPTIVPLDRITSILSMWGSHLYNAADHLKRFMKVKSKL